MADGEGGVHRLRRIVLKLDEPTRDGETEIVLVTNLPAEVAAVACCEAYRGRWRIEGHYQTLTDLLHCEVPGLGYPRAALFAFSMSAVAGNALAVLKGNLRVAHGDEMAAEVSDFALVDEIAEVYPGMMVAVPPARWPSLARGARREGGRGAERVGGAGAGASDVPMPAWPEEGSAEEKFGEADLSLDFGHWMIDFASMATVRRRKFGASNFFAEGILRNRRPAFGADRDDDLKCEGVGF